jgi:uncharacterized protein YprB with RNaseH-like and TPR domain
MAQNLRDRLRRIRELNGKGAAIGDAVDDAARKGETAGSAVFEGWVSAGFQTLKRVSLTETPSGFSGGLHFALPALAPDFGRGALPAPEELLFFDLETTGLSGGAGTTAFLAAFGRLERAAGDYALRVTQYLLLDYPGESDFLTALSSEFDGGRFMAVSYNGKSFDSQILKTRCLMNGMRPPEYRHADLLHPARRLWKRILPDCSQGTIETGVLGIDRSGDTPGALAPEIWFAFLKNGTIAGTAANGAAADGAAADGTAADIAPLLGVCDHNRRDITGLAAILAALNHIAADPVGALRKYRYDIEELALRWRRAGRGVMRHDFPPDAERALRAAGDELLRITAEQGCPGAALVYARDLLRRGNYGEARGRLSDIAAGNFPLHIRAAALRALAIDSEWRLGDAARALELANQGLELPGDAAPGRSDFLRRAERLKKKADRPRRVVEPEVRRGC